MIRDVFARRLCGKDRDPELHNTVKKLVDAWLELTAAGMTLISGNRKIQNLDDLDAFLNKDGLSVLKSIVATRSRLRQAQVTIEDLVALALSRISFKRDEVKKNSDVEEMSVVVQIPDNSLDSLLDLNMPEAFLTELKSDEFDDVVAFKAAALHKPLEEKLGKVCRGCFDPPEKQERPDNRLS